MTITHLLFGNRVYENFLPVILLLEQGPEMLLGADQSVAGGLQPTGAVVAFLPPLCAHLDKTLITQRENYSRYGQNEKECPGILR